LWSKISKIDLAVILREDFDLKADLGVDSEVDFHVKGDLTIGSEADLPRNIDLESGFEINIMKTLALNLVSGAHYIWVYSLRRQVRIRIGLHPACNIVLGVQSH
jgi:hypothetical protein